RLNELRINFIRDRAASGFFEVADGEVDPGHGGPAPRQHHGRHAVPATAIEDGLTPDIAEALERGADPGPVGQECGGAEDEVRPTGGAPCGLTVVKHALCQQTLTGVHWSSPVVVAHLTDSPAGCTRLN